MTSFLLPFCLGVILGAGAVATTVLQMLRRRAARPTSQ